MLGYVRLPYDMCRKQASLSADGCSLRIGTMHPIWPLFRHVLLRLATPDQHTRPSGYMRAPYTSRGHGRPAPSASMRRDQDFGGQSTGRRVHGHWELSVGPHGTMWARRPAALPGRPPVRHSVKPNHGLLRVATPPKPGIHYIATRGLRWRQRRQDGYGSRNADAHPSGPGAAHIGVRKRTRLAQSCIAPLPTPWSPSRVG